VTFVGSGEEAHGDGRLPYVQRDCAHEGFHDIRSAYDRPRGVLAFVWTCERCGAELQEVRRELYRPRYEPHGNDPFLESARPLRVA
jgi:hypothetical protein